MPFHRNLLFQYFPSLRAIVLLMLYWRTMRYWERRHENGWRKKTGRRRWKNGVLNDMQLSHWFIGISFYLSSQSLALFCQSTQSTRLYDVYSLYLIWISLSSMKNVHIQLRSWTEKSHQHVINTNLSQWFSCYSLLKLISNRFRGWMQQQEQIKLIKKIPFVFLLLIFFWYARNLMMLGKYSDPTKKPAACTTVLWQCY